MNTIGSHPGAILFRLSIMIILIAIMMVVFFRYLDETEKVLELSSIQQTKRIIDSSLAVVFATYATGGRLNELNDIDGGNPFIFLREFEIRPPGYRGQIEEGPVDNLESGWYYLKKDKRVVYKSRYTDKVNYFVVKLNYDDVNQSGSFEQGVDNFKNLLFVELNRI